jgi:hypothetical protein
LNIPEITGRPPPVISHNNKPLREIYDLTKFPSSECGIPLDRLLTVTEPAKQLRLSADNERLIGATYLVRDADVFADVMLARDGHASTTGHRVGDRYRGSRPRFSVPFQFRRPLTPNCRCY